MPAMMLLALASAVPEVPSSAVLVAREGDAFVMRNQIDDNPLYTFDQDEPGKSNCDETCASRWRPLRVLGSEEPIGQWTQIKRDDGSLQWAYDGMPVYSFAQDPEPAAASTGVVGHWRRLPVLPAQ